MTLFELPASPFDSLFGADEDYDQTDDLFDDDDLDLYEVDWDAEIDSYFDKELS